jgi:putative ABC transport system permease protein
VTRLRTFLSRLRGLVRYRQMDRDIEDEIAAHLAEARDEYIQQRLSPEDAHWAALRSFGGVTQTKQVYREVRSFAWLEAVARDLRFGARLLTRDRWITLTAVVALAIGIAANTTVFTIVSAILLRDLPFDEPDSNRSDRDPRCQRPHVECRRVIRRLPGLAGGDSDLRGTGRHERNDNERWR